MVGISLHERNTTCCWFCLCVWVGYRQWGGCGVVGDGRLPVNGSDDDAAALADLSNHHTHIHYEITNGATHLP
jgi:hypothetical protein